MMVLRSAMSLILILLGCVLSEAVLSCGSEACDDVPEPQHTVLLQRKHSLVLDSTRTHQRGPFDASIPLANAVSIEAPIEGGDWTTATCDVGEKILSGGCAAFGSPNKLASMEPVGDNGFVCGGHAGSKRAYAECVPEAYAPVIKSAEGGDWSTVTCDDGQKVIGGGCKALDSPYLFQSSRPEGDNGWTCGGLGGSKKVYAICVPAADAPEIKYAEGGDWTLAACDDGQQILGGGCEASGSPYFFADSRREGSSGWNCGGMGGAKKVWALCATTTTTTSTSTASCDGTTCKIWGDPHVSGFDNSEHEFPGYLGLLSFAACEGRTQPIDVNMYNDGDFWLVRSAELSIQSRFARSKDFKGEEGDRPAVGMLAISGSLLDNRLLSIPPLDKAVIWDGQQLSEATLDTNMTSGSRLRIRSDSKGPEGAHDLEVQLPKGVHLRAVRFPHHIDAAVTLPKSFIGTVDGLCGNRNGVADDDTQQIVAKRMHGITVSPHDRLLPA